jgi:hypothetical protein
MLKVGFQFKLGLWLNGQLEDQYYLFITQGKAAVKEAHQGERMYWIL